ncbi:MAG: phosphopyruvate hydratase, partial [bacterium]
SVTLDNGARGVASVAAGASTGTFEAHALFDGNGDIYHGMGVTKAVDNVNDSIAEALVGQSAVDQAQVDEILTDLDSSPNLSEIGANAVLGTSLAVARAAADASNQPLYRYLGGLQANILPTPIMTMILGGMRADNGLEVERVMLLPHNFDDFSEAVRAGLEIRRDLKCVLKGEGLSIDMGVGGGFVPQLGETSGLPATTQALHYVMEAIRVSSYQPGRQVSLGLDVAASELLETGDGGYRYDGEILSAEELIAVYRELAEDFPLALIQDGMGEEQANDWIALKEALGAEVRLIGNNVFVSNDERLQKGIEMNMATGLTVMPNQIGTLTGTLSLIGQAQRAGYAVVISSRYGETDDPFIADLAVATGADFIDVNAPVGINVTKINRLLGIEEQLGSSARFVGLGEG